MKKITYFLSIVMLLCLCGCGNNAFNNPDINTVKDKINTIDKISDICVVTEDNDPNGKLNKQGGYTGALFFTYDEIDLTNIKGENACERTTDGGGSIEVYENEEDANKRNDYLSNFDGGILSVGYHIVEGTVVIRISDELTATQQKELAEKIINAIEE